jgi:hypothetical protein
MQLDSQAVRYAEVPRAGVAPETVSLDSSYFVDQNPATLQPSEEAVVFLRRKLWQSAGGNPRGFIVVSGLEAFMQRHGLHSFQGELPGSTLPDSTRFLQNWTRAAYRLRQEEIGESTHCRVRHVAFNGLEESESPSHEGYMGYGGAVRYLKISRRAVNKAVARLVDQASRCGAELDANSFHRDYLLGQHRGSTKRIHFDANTEVGVLQRFSDGVEGGDLQLYDVGAFCNETGVRPWEVVVPYAVPLDGCAEVSEATLRGPAYIVTTIRDRYLADITAHHVGGVPGANDHTVIFNNGIQVDAETQKVFAVAHGATAIHLKREGAVRNLILSVLHL